MISVEVIYHHEDGTWWADSATVPGFVAAGATLHEVRALVKDGIPFYLEVGSDEIDLYEQTAPIGPVATVKVTSPVGSQSHGMSAASPAVTSDLVFAG